MPLGRGRCPPLLLDREIAGTPCGQQGNLPAAPGRPSAQEDAPEQPIFDARPAIERAAAEKTKALLARDTVLIIRLMVSVLDRLRQFLQ